MCVSMGAWRWKAAGSMDRSINSPVRLEEVEDGVQHAAEVRIAQHRDARQHLGRMR